MEPDQQLKRVKFAPDGEQLIWDASSLAVLQQCARRYDLAIRQGWQFRGGRPETNWGTAVHKGLEIMNAAQAETGDRRPGVAPAVQYLLTDPYGLAASEDSARTIWTSARCIVWYDEQYKGDSLKTAVLPDGRPALEVRFEFAIPGLDRRISGRIDQIATLDGDLYIVDHKTTLKALGPWYFREYTPNLQVYLYILALRRYLHLPVQGVIVDAIQAAAGFNRFSRQAFRVTDAQLDEFEQQLVYHINLAKDHHTKGEWPQSFSACGNYGGCMFREVCDAPPARRSTWLTSRFERRAQEYGGSSAV